VGILVAGPRDRLFFQRARVKRAGDDGNMRSSKRTTDHEQIRRWAEARSGKPVRVQGTAKDDDAGLLRIDFPDDNDDEEDLEEISWDEFFEKFDEKRLAFVYQEKTASGEPSRFNRLVSR